jgi:hypothetical protein
MLLFLALSEQVCACICHWNVKIMSRSFKLYCVSDTSYMFPLGMEYNPMCPFRTRHLNEKSCPVKYFAFIGLDLHDPMMNLILAFNKRFRRRIPGDSSRSAEAVGVPTKIGWIHPNMAENYWRHMFDQLVEWPLVANYWRHHYRAPATSCIIDRSKMKLDMIGMPCVDMFVLFCAVFHGFQRLSW